MEICLAGSRWLGAEVLKNLLRKHSILAVSAPAGDRLYEAAHAMRVPRACAARYAPLGLAGGRPLPRFYQRGCAEKSKARGYRIPPKFTPEAQRKHVRLYIS